jgi:hypothetical protein
MCWLAQVRFPVEIKNVSFLETMKFQHETFSQWENMGKKRGAGGNLLV